MTNGVANLSRIPELKRRILLTVLLIGVYRLGIFVPTPGIDPTKLKHLFEQTKGTLLGLFNMFSGGALEQFSIFTLGIMPYISASIILQLLTMVVPALEQVKKEGEAGRRKITQYTRYGTVILALIQGTMFCSSLAKQGVTTDPNPGLMFYSTAVLTLASGTAFIMWLGEQITERGIGNGISLIIFAGIVASLPQSLQRVYVLFSEGQIGFLSLIFLAGVVAGVIWLIVYFERCHRQIPVQYAKRVVGRKMYGGMTTSLPLKINQAGVIPPIFASSILMFPATFAGFSEHPNWFFRTLQGLFAFDSWFHSVAYVLLIIFFCYFYTAVTFNPIDVAENMKKTGGYIPGIRPGKKTADYIDDVLTKITFAGAIYIASICLLPTIVPQLIGMSQETAPFYFGGTGLLIVVGVAMDTVSQIETHLVQRHYDGFLGPKGRRIRGRRG